MLSSRPWLAACFAAGSALTVLHACALESLNPVDLHGSGGTGGVDTSGPGGSGGGTGGEDAPLPDRGDPSTFPSECLSECQEACARLTECGAQDSPIHPMAEDECLARCVTAEDGLFWDDVSSTFKCCASQPECGAVQHCGGWLGHGDAAHACVAVCGCFGGDQVALSRGSTPPEGYRFLPDAVFVETLDAGALAGIDGVLSVRAGRFPLVSFDPALTAQVVAALEAQGRMLPTLVDRAGAFAAVNGRLVVEAPAATLPEVERIGRRHGYTSPRPLSIRRLAGKGASLYLLEGQDGWAALRALADFATLAPAGVRAELDLVRRQERRYVPQDPLYGGQWHLRNVGQGVSTPSVDARVNEAWDALVDVLGGLGSSDVIIAINDDGVEIGHPDFKGRLLPELNFEDGWQDNPGFGGHGTSVAGVALAAADDALGGAGVCPNCRLLPHQLGPTSGDGFFDASDVEVAQGFAAQVDAGAWIISNSWGLRIGDPSYVTGPSVVPTLPSVVEAAFDHAEAEGRGGLGTVIVYAAGNTNDQLDHYGKHPTTVTVAAVGDLGLKAYYSSFGVGVTVAAPSNGALTGITTTAVGGGYTDSFGGTSSACPVVAGVLGLMFSVNPELTAARAREILAESATPIDPVFGAYDANGISPYYGHGLVNAYTAVQLASGACEVATDCPAPSDDCGDDCGTETLCGECRTQADCAEGHVCQALPSVGAMVCVPARGEEACPEGTHEQLGHCLPLPATCGACTLSEECNGRDDDCDGQVDEDDACEGSARCFIDGPGCAEGTVCAGTACLPTCSTSDDCADWEECRQTKTQYGKGSGKQACFRTVSGGCPFGCSVYISTLHDEDLDAFTGCVADAGDMCGAVAACSPF